VITPRERLGIDRVRFLNIDVDVRADGDIDVRQPGYLLSAVTNIIDRAGDINERIPARIFDDDLACP
jgi:hypothetical protein